MKQWMKKSLILLCSVALVVLGSFGFVACDKEEDSQHVHSYTETVVDATCEAEGLKTFTCACGDVKTETLPKLAHTEEVLPAVPATCSATGLTEGKRCAVCEEVIIAQEVTQKTQHTEEIIPAVAATCESTGLTEGKKCSVCKEILVAQEVTQKAQHTEEIIPAVAATCTSTGLTEGKKCSVCKEVLVAQEVTQKAQHTEEIIPAVNPTCTEEGLTEGKKCSVCKEVLVAQETVKANGHTEETVNGKAATCTQDGLTVGVKCSVCKEVLTAQQIIPANGHTEEVLPAVEPTCTETGLTEGKKCSVCKEITVAQETVKANGHTEITLDAVAPNCTETGLTEGKKCTVCKEITVAQEIVPANGHTEEIIPAVAPTCTDTGLTEGKKCTVCKEITVAQETVAANGHTETTLAAVASTCTTTGLTEGKKCTVCKEITVAQEEVPANGHTDEILPAVEPTCTETGLTEGKKCSVCGEVLTAQEIIPANGHTDEILPAVEPTCTETGLTEGKKCSVCGEVLIAQEIIPANGHTEEEIPAVEPTCTTTGLTAGVKCSVCGEILTTQDEVSMLEHAYEEERVEPDCLTEGYTKQVCGDCGFVKPDSTTILPAAGHSYEETVTAPTCGSQGYTTYTCSCGNSYTGNYTDPLDEHAYALEPEVVEPTCEEQGYTIYKCECGETKNDNFVAATGHTYTDERIDKPATCTETGVKFKICACGHEEKEDIAIIDHDYSETTFAPTCEEAGYILYTCACGDSYTEETAPATGHNTEVKDEEKSVAPTCEEEGIDYFPCSNEGCQYTREQTVAATGHTFKAGEVIAPTCEAEGYTVYNCACGATENRDPVDALGHDYQQDGEPVAATCESAGYTYYKCVHENCEEGYSVETKALGHSIDPDGWTAVVDEKGEIILTLKEGCTYEKQFTNTCGTCGATLTKTEEEEKHDYVSSIEVKATCQTAGVQRFTCTCGDSYTQDYTDSEAHNWEGDEIAKQCTICGTKKTTVTADSETETTLSQDALAQEGEVEVQFSGATVKLDESTKNQLAGSETSLYAGTLSEEDRAAEFEKNADLADKVGDNPIYNFTVNDGQISQFDGMMTITVPYDLGDEDPESLYIWYLNDNGEVESIKATYEEIDGQGYATFQTNHFSKYTVVRLTPSERCAIYGHNSKTRIVPATCTVDGYELEYCIRCGYNATLNIYPATGHSYETYTTPATCTSQGYDYHECTACDTNYKDNYTNALGHNYIGTVVEPTCIATGYTQYVCDRCFNSYQGDHVAATGHDYTVTVIEPTCTLQGKTEHLCENCQDKYYDAYVPATGHEYEDGVTHEPTCSDRGYTEIHCKHCDHGYHGKWKPAKGHDYKNKHEHAPTCQETGYTEYSCDCGVSYRADLKPKAGHDFETTGTEHEPTCNEQGYTRYKCKHCDKFYDGNFKDKKKHVYKAAETVAPTCIEKGYTVYVCNHPGCHDFYRSDYVAEVGHKYNAEYVCENCGALHPMIGSNEKGFYGTLAESVLNAESFYVTVEDLLYDYTYESADSTQINKATVEIFNLSFAFDEDGYIVGNGEFVVPVYSLREYVDNRYNTDYEDGYTASLQAVFMDGMLYAYASTDYEDDYDDYSSYLIVTQDWIFENIGLNKALRQVFNEIMVQQTRDIVTAALGITNADTNDAIGGLVEYLFAKTETEDGFVFTFDLQRVYDMIDSASKQTVAEWFNGIFGDGALEAVFTNVNSLLDKTIGEIATEVEANLAVAGYTMEDLYSTVDNIVDQFGNEEFSLEEIVDEYSDLVVIDLIAQGNPEMEQQVRDTLKMAEQMCHETDIVSLIIDIVSSSMGGNERPDGGIIYPSSSDNGWTSNYDSSDYSSTGDLSTDYVPDSSYDVTTGYNLSSDSAYDSNSDSSASGDVDDGANDRVAYILDMIQMAIDYCGASEISFKTDKKGNMLSFTLNLDVDADMSQNGNTDIGIIKGLARIELNKTYEMDTEELLKRMDALWAVSQFKEGSVIQGNDDSYESYEATYVVAYNGNEIWFVQPFNMRRVGNAEQLGTEVIDGVEYMCGIAYTYSSAYYYSDLIGITTESICGDWANYNVLTRYTQRTYYKIWITADGDLYKAEVDYQMTKDNAYDNDTYGFDFWYNELTDEYRKTDVHTFEIVEERLPTQCGEEGYTVYQCTACGNSYKTHHYLDHQYESKYELIEGASSCEEGCIYSEVCVNCGDVQFSKMDTWHNTRWQRVFLDTPCGKMEFSYGVCACGEEFNGVGFSDGCKMEESINDLKDENGWGMIQTHRCMHCGYTVELQRTQGYANCYSTGTFKITADGEVIVEKSYRRSSHNTYSKTVENADGSLETIDICNDCGKVVLTSKFDAQGREYYSVNENGFGYRVEYQGCHYVRTYFNANGDVYSDAGTNHIGESRYEYYLASEHATSCKDGVCARVYCSFCGEYKYDTSFDDQTRHFFNVEYKTFNTACGVVTVEYAVCACGKMQTLGDVHGDCALEENGDTRVCATCGWTIKAENFTQATDGCCTTISATYYFGYVDGYAEWTFDFYYVQENHSFVKFNDTEDGYTVYGSRCENCGYVLEKRYYDEYEREIKYVDARGNGWYWQFIDGCMAEKFYTYSDGTVEEGYERRKFCVESIRYEFLTEDRNCENGVRRIDYCAACGEQRGENTYYHHERRWTTEYLNTGCGQIRIEINACACGYYSEVYVEPKAGCYFEQTDGYPKTDAEGNEIGHGEVYTCVYCGYVYVREYYCEQIECTRYEYQIYRFDVTDEGWEKEISSVRKHTSHNETWEEGATDDGCYLYERYCLDCGKQFEHRKTKNDEYERPVYYYDYLTMSGWVRVYADDCTYQEFALNANEEVGTEVIGSGYGHSAIQYRAELMDGAENCEEGIYWIRYCEACGREEERWNMNSHERFGHKVKITTDCGIVYAIYNECACGQVKDTGVAFEGACLIQHRDTHWFDDEENKFVHNLETYVCAVTDCGFTYTHETYSYYPESENCKLEWVHIYNAYVDDSVVFTYTATSTGYGHITETTTEYDANGYPISVNRCKYCEYVEKYDRFGRTLYRWQPEYDYGECYDYYDGCYYNHYAFNSCGERWDEYSSEGHLWYTRHIEEACTQYGTAIEYCACCNMRQEYNYVEPRHDYYWNEELQTYVCNRCGLENQTGVDGYFLVEDLSDRYGAYTVGFFNRNGLGWNMEEGYNFYIVLNYDENNVEDMVVTEGVKFDLFEYGYEYGGAGSGIVTLDTESLRAAVVEAFGENMEGFESVSIVFQAFDRDRLDYYDHVLTFDRNYM